MTLAVLSETTGISISEFLSLFGPQGERMRLRARAGRRAEGAG
ncbi:hypothetical protein AB0N47_10985 [Streptomyces griseoluteus]